MKSIPVYTYIDSTSHIAEHVTIGEGSIILSGAVIDIYSSVMENVVISNETFISHNVVMQPHTYCSARVNIAGKTNVGKRCFIGIGSTIIDNIVIGDDVTVAAGSVVTRNVKDKVLVAGVPAKVKKKYIVNSCGIFC